MATSSTRLVQHVAATPADVYRALLDPAAIAIWKVPDGMTSRVDAFDAREGGAFRISLTYQAPTTAGKTDAQTDTYHGRFVKLVPNRTVIEAIEFETDDPTLHGPMTITYVIEDAGGGTDLRVAHDDLPPGLSPAQNEIGWRMSLEKLARLVEGGRSR